VYAECERAVDNVFETSFSDEGSELIFFAQWSITSVIMKDSVEFLFNLYMALSEADWLY